MMTFGQRLKYFRKTIMRQTRKEFADYLNVSLGNIQAWELERNGIRRESIEKLTHGINQVIEKDNIRFNMEWLFNGTGNILPEDKKQINEPSHHLITYKVSSFLYEPLIKNGTVLTLKKIDFKHIKTPSIIGYKDESGVFYFGMVIMSKNNQPILHYYAGSMHLLVLSENDELYSIVAHTTDDCSEMAA